MRRLDILRSSVSLVLATILAFPSVAFSGDDKKKDPEAIGDRNVSGKVNFYSLEKEIALGKRWRKKWSGSPRSSTIRSSPNT